MNDSKDQEKIETNEIPTEPNYGVNVYKSFENVVNTSNELDCEKVCSILDNDNNKNHVNCEIFRETISGIVRIAESENISNEFKNQAAQLCLEAQTNAYRATESNSNHTDKQIQKVNLNWKFLAGAGILLLIVIPYYYKNIRIKNLAA